MQYEAIHINNLYTIWTSLKGEWKEEVETETLQDYFDGFTDFNVQLSKDNLFHNHKKCDVVLLIIAKAKMFGGHCYLGLSQEDKTIHRYVNMFLKLSLILIQMTIRILSFLGLF